jgi:hypothetical protein
MQDAGETWEVCPDEPFVFGKAFEGYSRGVAQGLVGDALMRADEGAAGLRDGESEEKVWPGELFFAVVV